jgi:Pyruvate/2-oxoacid:ferredoxin oxidoreductase gamma subunit
VEITGLVTREALRAAVAETVFSGLRELNLKAVDIGFKLGEKAKVKG